MAKSNLYIVSEYNPRPFQEQMHAGMESHRWSIIVAHRRFGKTVCVINHIIKMATLCSYPRPQFAYLAPTYAQAKKVSWEYLKHYTSTIPNCKINESELWIQLPNQGRIMLAGADNPDSLRGIYLDGVVLDEVAQMKPSAWREVIRPTLSDRNGWAVFIGTPKGINMFYDIWIEAQDDPSWYKAMFKSSKTKLVPSEDLEAAYRTMGESQYLQEYECDWSANNVDTIMSYLEVNDAMNRNYHVDDYRFRPLVIGVDPARFGSDKTAICVRQGLQLLEIRVWDNLDTMTIADIVQKFVSHYRPDAIFIDSVGVGAGVVDRLLQLGHDIISVNGSSSPSDSDRYSNKRAEMWFRLKHWLQAGGAISEDAQLKTELLSPTFSFDNKNRIRLERKEDMKKRGLPSPDMADALALTFAQEIHKTRWEGDHNKSAIVDYDPYDEAESNDDIVRNYVPFLEVRQ